MGLLSVKLIKTILLAGIMLLTFSSVVQGATKTWAGGTGTLKNWNTIANWSPTGVPVAGDDVVFNTAGTITFSTLPGADIAYNSLTISQGTVTLAGTTRTFTLGNKTGVDFTVANGATLVTTNVNITLAASATATIAGTFTVSSGLTFITNGTSVATTVSGTGIINNLGTVTCATDSKLIFQSGTTYIHAQNGGTIPTATWSSGSLLKVTGITTTIVKLPSSINGSVEWNCPSQTVNGDIYTGVSGGATFTVGGNFIVSNTNTGYISLFSLSKHVLNIGGNYSQTNGTLIVEANGMNDTQTLNISGNFTLSGGTFNFTSNTGNTNTINILGDWTQSAGTITETNAISGNINFSRSGTQIYTKSGGTISNTINFAVLSGSTLNMGTSVIDGSIGTFTLNSGAGIITAHTQGLSTTAATGSIQVTGTKTFNAAANYTYNGTSAQVTGNGLTGANNLTINNSAGVSLSTATTIVSGVLTLTSGILTTGANTLSVTNNAAGAITGYSGSSYVNGKLAWTYSAAGSKTFPIGKGGNYRPLTINFSALTGTSTVTVEQIEAALPGTLPAKTTLFSNRYWQISQSGGSNLSFFVTLDGTGWSKEGTPKMLKGNGTANASYDVSGINFTNTIAFTSFENFGLGETDIFWTGSVSNDWFTPSNWSSVLVPTGTIGITIPSSLTRYPVISGVSNTNDVTIKNTLSLTLEDGAIMTLEAGPVLTFESGATVTTGTGSKIILKSDAVYVNLSNSTPALEMERILSGVKGWRMVASPLNTKFNDMFTSPLITQGFTGSTYPLLQPNLMWWDETDPGTTLQSWRKPANLTDDVIGGRGLFHYIFNGAGITSGGTYADVLPQTMTVTGVENYNGSGSYNYNLSYTVRTAPSTGTNYYDVNALDQGWNLIGNPTASTLNWDATAAWTKTNVDNTIYVWDPSALNGNGDYLNWNGSTGTLPNGKIPPFQAFWVHANTTSPVLNFTNAAKATTAGTFMRSPAIDESLNIPITLSSQGMETTSVISFTDNGIKGPDNKDAYRLEPMNDSWIELYTLSSADHVSPLTINNLPINDSDLVNIPLYVGSQIEGGGNSGQTSLKWKIPENWPSAWNISLQDHQISKSVSMTENTEYTFNHIANQIIKSAAPGAMYAPKQLLKYTLKKNKPEIKKPDFNIVISKNGKTIGYMEPVPHFILNYPNPFSNTTTLSFSLPKSEQVRMEVYNLNGTLFEILTNRIYPAGISEIQWQPVTKIPGVYFVRFISGDIVETRKVIFQN